MTTPVATKEKCKSCDREIEVCECCEQPGCPAAICYECQNRKLKPNLRHPHAHGG